jgi:DMSO/TMAO reductase YedYZ molybdopterin-dependent catalytic subunit
MSRTDPFNDVRQRRRFLRLLGGAAAATAAAPVLMTTTSAAGAAEQGAPAARPLNGDGGLSELQFPEKIKLVVRTDRPPNLEMPLKYLREDLTPNEAFYVRWHLGITPTRVDVNAFRLSLGGHVERPLKLSLDEIRKGFEPVSVIAVNQCSGNSRSLYEPRMPGVQWGNGAIGNARWTGVRLKDLLAKAGAKSGAVDVSFGGMDGPTIPAAANFAGTPDFAKSLPFAKANEDEVLVAYEMNGKPLPMLNGFPLRLVVPGWYATYWVKSLDEINVLDKPFEGFWMAKAYRVPKTKDFQEDPKNLAKETAPISKMSVRSLFAQPEANESIMAGAPYEVQGVALDGGAGIARVEVSADGGKTWEAAKLDPEIGKFSWRRWRHAWTPAQPGKVKLMVRATNNAGETQTTSQWNRSGYARNVIESVDVTVTA